MLPFGWEHFYDFRISIRFLLAALLAGRMPKTMPTMLEIAKVPMMEPSVMTGLNGKNAVIIQAIKPPRTRPTTPPVNVSMTDSNRNCFIISAGVAPTAILMPISCERSEAEMYTVSYTHLTLPTNSLV